jgi:hypothetical protein
LKPLTLGLTFVVLAASASLPAQTTPATTDTTNQPTMPPYMRDARAARAAAPAPWSRLAIEGGIGIGGINMQAAVEANRYVNIRGIGNYFTYSVNNVKIGGNNGSSGANVSGKLNFAEGGIAMDYYPWPNHGFRLSPGVTFFNGNTASASGVLPTGNSITFNSVKYYSESANPMSLNANLGLNTHKQAFTATTGLGNMISRRGGHWAFPVELGAIFTGVPTVNLNITGYGCTVQSDAAINGPSCVNMASNTSAQTNVNSQVSKYENDLNPLKVWPIMSFGVSYNFRIH